MKTFKALLIAASLAAYSLPAMATEGRVSDPIVQQTEVGTAAQTVERSYADREAASKDLEKFAGGDGTSIYLSSGAAAVVIVIIVLLIVF